MKLKAIITTFFVIALCTFTIFAQKAQQPSGPQLIRDADHPARQPFFKSVEGVAGQLGVTVPAGKSLVIEAITGRALMGSSAVGPLVLYIWDPTMQNQYKHWIAPTYHDAVSNSTFYTHQVRYVIPAGHYVDIDWWGNGTVLALNINVSGYYIDMP